MVLSPDMTFNGRHNQFKVIEVIGCEADLALSPSLQLAQLSTQYFVIIHCACLRAASVVKSNVFAATEGVDEAPQSTVVLQESVDQWVFLDATVDTVRSPRTPAWVTECPRPALVIVAA